MNGGYLLKRIHRLCAVIFLLIPVFAAAQFEGEAVRLDFVGSPAAIMFTPVPGDAALGEDSTLYNYESGRLLLPPVPAASDMSNRVMLEHYVPAVRTHLVFQSEGPLVALTGNRDTFLLSQDHVLGKTPITHIGPTGLRMSFHLKNHPDPEIGSAKEQILRVQKSLSEGKHEEAAALLRVMMDNADKFNAELAETVVVPARLNDGPLAIDAPERTAPFKERFVFVKGGEFMKGSPPTDKERFPNEDQSLVEVQPFHIAKWQTTQAEFLEKMGWNPSRFTEDDGEGDHRDGINVHHPVENVSLYDAMEYANKRSDDEGYAHAYKLDNIERDSDGSITSAKVTLIASNGYRLPTEDEWEYAAREAGQATGPRPFDAAELNEYTWNVGKSERTHAVGRRRASKLGLRDMLGNVWEWTQSIYEDSRRVIRGGSWDRDPRNLRPASRSYGALGYRTSLLGFRLVRSSR